MRRIKNRSIKRGNRKKNPDNCAQREKVLKNLIKEEIIQKV